ncbi:MAG: LPXTG cell wall anchor domain-containing protein [Actinomycetota bacterium]|nr:LPXTG cell wall anchor domain-containing protein [Actinomycetota bacterium]
MTERYSVHVTRADGAKAAWLVAAVGSSTADASSQPTVLTVEHLVDWAAPPAETPRVAGASASYPASSPSSTTTTTVPDPFGPSGSGGGGSGGGATTTTTSPTATAPAGPGKTTTTTTPFGSGTTATTAPAAPGKTTTTTTPATGSGSTGTGGSSGTSVPSGSVSGSGSGAPRTSLPYTGVNADLELEVAGLALLLGSGVLVATRRRAPLAHAGGLAVAGAPPPDPGTGRALAEAGSEQPWNPLRRPAAPAHRASRLSWPLRRPGSGGAGLDGVLARDSLAEGPGLDWITELAERPDVEPSWASTPTPATVSPGAAEPAGAPLGGAWGDSPWEDSPWEDIEPAGTPHGSAWEDIEPAVMPASELAPRPASGPHQVASSSGRGPLGSTKAPRSDASATGAAAVPTSGGELRRAGAPRAGERSPGRVSPLVDVLVPLGGWKDGEWCFDRPLGDLLDPVFGGAPAEPASPGDR